MQTIDIVALGIGALAFCFRWWLLGSRWKPMRWHEWMIIAGAILVATLVLRPSEFVSVLAFVAVAFAVAALWFDWRRESRGANSAVPADAARRPRG